MEKKQTRFCPEGTATVGLAAEFKEQILNCLKQDNTLLIDLSRVTKIDLSFVQILIALKNEAYIREKQIKFTGLDCEVVKDIFLKAGCNVKLFF